MILFLILLESLAVKAQPYCACTSRLMLKANIDTAQTYKWLHVTLYHLNPPHLHYQEQDDIVGPR